MSVCRGWVALLGRSGVQHHHQRTKHPRLLPSHNSLPLDSGFISTASYNTVYSLKLSSQVSYQTVARVIVAGAAPLRSSPWLGQLALDTTNQSHNLCSIQHRNPSVQLAASHISPSFYQPLFFTRPNEGGRASVEPDGWAHRSLVNTNNHKLATQLTTPLPFKAPARHQPSHLA